VLLFEHLRAAYRNWRIDRPALTSSAAVCLIKSILNNGLDFNVGMMKHGEDCEAGLTRRRVRTGLDAIYHH
jgi:hypothetical protein